MLVTNSIIYDLITISVTLLAAAVAYYKWTFYYWKRKGLKGPEPSIPFGNIKDLVLRRKHFAQVWADTYFYLKSRKLDCGVSFFFAKPVIIVTDLQLVKNILQTDFDHFWGHGSYVNEEADPLSAHLFALEGPKWRTMRTKLSPTFTSGKMKMMFQTLLSCSDHLKSLLDDYCCRKAPVDVKDIMRRFTTDIIASCAFGVECNALKNPDTEFCKRGHQVADQSLDSSLRLICQMMLPKKLLDFIKFSVATPEVRNFFMGLVKQTISYREANNVTRKDFMDLLIQLKNKGFIDEKDAANSKGGTLTVNDVAAQTFIFFLAGFETSSTTMNCAAYELALNLEIQDELRKEIHDVIKKYNNQITYEAIMDMPLLDKVLFETLRKYPSVPQLFRRCNKDYTIPNTNIKINNGTSVMIPIFGIHYDPEYYPNPEKFDPDRFTEANKAKRPNYTWLPFGEGPRICIGLRFGLMQAKIGLITLLRNYRITINKKTVLPPAISKNGILFSFQDELWMDLHKDSVA